MIIKKEELKTVGFIHSVNESLTKVNHELIEKMNKFSAPSYMLIILHNAMELMLKDFFLSRDIDTESWGPQDLLKESKIKIPFVKNNYPKFVAFNKSRNDVYHRTMLVPRIENLKDDYKLLIGLYRDIYKRKFIPITPTKYLITALVFVYSLLLTIVSFQSAGSYSPLIFISGILIFPTSFFFLFMYIVSQKELNGYIPLFNKISR